MGCLGIEEVTLELLKLSRLYLISESLSSRRLPACEIIGPLGLLVIWKMMLLMSDRTFDLNLLCAPIM